MNRRTHLALTLLALAGLAVAVWLSGSQVPPTPALPSVPHEAAGTGALQPLSARPLPSLDAMPDAPDVATGWNGLPCSAGLSTKDAGRPGFVRLILLSPCQPGARADIAYGPIRFSAELSTRGAAGWVLPVLHEGWSVEATVGGERLDVSVPGHATARSVTGLSWPGGIALDLAAFEFGAIEGESGHVTEFRPGAGQVLRYGDGASGPAALVYAGPDAGGPGRVRFAVDVEPTAGSCPIVLPITAFSATGGGVEVRDIRLTIDDCTLPPGSLALKNLLGDLTIAGR